MEHYTISEASEMLGIKKRKIWEVVRSGKVKSTKDKGQSSPYKIPETELDKIKQIVNSKAPTQDKVKVIAEPESKSNLNSTSNSDAKVASEALNTKHYEDFIQMQKILMETMHNLAGTQDKIAEALIFLAKKM